MTWTDPATGEVVKTSLDYVHPAYRERAAALLSTQAPDDPIAIAHLHLGEVNRLKDLAANHQIRKAMVGPHLDAVARERKRAQSKK